MTTAPKAWFLDDEPSQRFPVYCRGNVGEIVPNVATPLTATITIPAFRSGFTALFESVGVFTADELADPAATGGLFGGYLYFNVSFTRTFAARLPGMRIADVDRQLLGSHAQAVPPHRRGRGDRSPRTFGRTLIGLARMAWRRERLDLDSERLATEQWLAGLATEPTAAEVIDVAAHYTARFETHLRALLTASMGAGIPSALLERLATRAERAEPGLLVKAMSGLGTIETARPAVALWHLGRLVADSAALTRLFAAGTEGLYERLSTAREEDATTFRTQFDDFLAEHGHRGPNEVELASDTWTTAPGSALALVDRLRLSPSTSDPDAAAVRLAAERDAARSRLRAGMARPLRPLVDRLLASASSGTARREQAKGTLVLGLSGVRRLLFGLADDLVRGGDLEARRDLFMATIDELPALVEDARSLRPVLAERMRRYRELDQLDPPFAFEGQLPDPSSWRSRGGLTSLSARATELRGIGAAAGKASGRVRVITDPSDPRGLAPGEVLVAPLTDPAWTPLFLAAVAVVVEVGALQSHAAIVARELGIPAVVSADGATEHLSDGDFVEVDGDRGVVRLMERSV